MMASNRWKYVVCETCGSRGTEQAIANHHPGPRCTVALVTRQMHEQGWAPLYAPHRAWLSELSIPFKRAPYSLRKQAIYDGPKWIRNDEVIDERWWAPDWAVAICMCPALSTQRRKSFLNTVERDSERGPALMASIRLAQGPNQFMPPTERLNVISVTVRAWMEQDAARTDAEYVDYIRNSLR